MKEKEFPQEAEIRTRVMDLRRQVDELHGGAGVTFSSEDLPLEVEEEFLKHVIAYETATPVPLFEVLKGSGIELPDPGTLNETEVTGKLWEVINAMASLGVSLENTDHLSDRELYSALWAELLREDAVIFPDDSSYVYHIDVLGSGSEEDTYLYMKYFADEDYRERWMESFPDYEMPQREKPKFDRDRRIPRPRRDLVESWG